MIPCQGSFNWLIVITKQVFEFTNVNIRESMIVSCRNICFFRGLWHIQAKSLEAVLVAVFLAPPQNVSKLRFYLFSIIVLLSGFLYEEGSNRTLDGKVFLMYSSTRLLWYSCSRNVCSYQTTTSITCLLCSL